MKKETNELLRAAGKMADAYRAWVTANAEYNSLLASRAMPGTFNTTHTINWEAPVVTKTKKRK